MKRFLIRFCVVGLVASVHAIGPLGTFGVGVASSKCEPSITTASGPYAVHKGKNWLELNINHFNRFDFIFWFVKQQRDNIALEI